MPATEQGVAVSRQRYKLIPRVLCFVLHQGEVLLLQGAPTKKSGLIASTGWAAM